MANRKSTAMSNSAAPDCGPHPEAYFDLIDEPWVPVVWKPGTRGPGAVPEEVGLGEVFQRAHDISEVGDASPLVTAALHRLLIALVHAAHQGPATLNDWKAIWEVGSFDESLFKTYFKKWRDRFWLLHPERPFLQWPGNDLGTPKPVRSLDLSTAAGSNATLFDHSVDVKPKFVPFARCVRTLLGYLAFVPGGGVPGVSGKGNAAPWKSGCALIGLGKSLFQTLLFNVIPQDLRPEALRECGKPEWQLASPSPPTSLPQSKSNRAPSTYLEYLTAPSRRIRLCPGPQFEGVVHARINVGVAYDSTTLWDPFMSVLSGSKKAGPQPLRLSLDRALWRDSTTLTAWRIDEAAGIAGPVRLMGRLVDRGVLPDTQVFRLGAFGLRSGKKAQEYLFWRSEFLPVTAPLLTNDASRVEVETCLEIAEDIAKALWSSAETLSVGLLARSTDSAPKPEDIRKVITHLNLMSPYWAQLESPFKEQVLLGLPDSRPEERDDLSRRWARYCRDVARVTLERVIEGMEPTGGNLRAASNAQGRFNYLVRELFRKRGLSEEEQDGTDD